MIGEEDHDTGIALRGARGEHVPDSGQGVARTASAADILRSPDVVCDDGLVITVSQREDGIGIGAVLDVTDVHLRLTDGQRPDDVHSHLLEDAEAETADGCGIVEGNDDVGRTVGWQIHICSTNGGGGARMNPGQELSNTRIETCSGETMCLIYQQFLK